MLLIIMFGLPVGITYFC
uniref:Uncharacterized protein n=1 Tax=Arundo donax TaxID=35708 RepID=A0A0A9I3E3_ARUDO